MELEDCTLFLKLLKQQLLSRVFLEGVTTAQSRPEVLERRWGVGDRQLQNKKKFLTSKIYGYCLYKRAGNRNGNRYF